MNFCRPSFFYRFSRILLYAMLVGAAAVAVPSCSGSKKSADVKKMERASKKDYRTKEVRKAEEDQERKRQQLLKDAEKARQDGITRHREMQTQEVRDRMDENLKISEEKNRTKKEFFLVRWFRPKDDIEKIEKRRAKEVKKRMAASRKKAEKNNEERFASSFKTEERKVDRPKPSDYQHGGGGTYEEGKSKSRVNPSDIQHGGGGTYEEGKSKKRANPADYQQGGGGSYQEGKSKRVKPESGAGNTKGTSPRKNPFSRKSKPKAGE